MLFSFNKLKELSKAPKNWTVEEMVEALNKLGFEVEGYKKFIDAEGVKFGKLLKIEKHPKADKLLKCEVEFSDKKRTILTNATNPQEGKYVVAFIPGSRLGDVTFEAKDLKGIKSEGMFSALSEFGIDESLVPTELKEGIWLLNKANLEHDPIEKLGLNDYIIEIDLLSNRSDAQSYWVIATELAAFLNKEVKIFEEFKKPTGKPIFEAKKGKADLLSVSEAKDINIKTSYEDQLLLIKSGIKVQHPVVNITNLALIMTGQPVHAYDSAKINKKITAKSVSGKATLLDGTEVEYKNALLISDGSKNISAAGVMGFKNTAISSETTGVVFEVGNFNIKQVRETWKQTKLDSLSARQSSKKLGIGTQWFAWSYISNKIKLNSISGLDLNLEQEIQFSKEELFKVIGHEVNQDTFDLTIKKMEILGFKYNKNSFEVPSYRHDIEQQQDLNEEFIRLYGYDNLKPQPLNNFTSIIKQRTLLNKEIAANGYQEVSTYTLISKEKNAINPFKFKKDINLETFISKERETVRNSMAISLLEVIKYNQKRKVENINIFDIGQINEGVEVMSIASDTKTFNEIKQDVLNILNKEVTFERFSTKGLHPNVSAKIIHKGQMIGWIGKVHPSIDKTNAYIAEVKIEKNNKDFKLNLVESTQMKTRDITFDLKPKEDIGPKLNAMSNDLFSIKVIDIYEKDNSRKVTIRAIGSDKQIEKIETLIKKSK